MKKGIFRFWAVVTLVLTLGAAPPALLADSPSTPTPVQGPFVGQPVTPVVWNGDLRDLPQLEGGEGAPREVPSPRLPGKGQPPAPADWTDPLAQTWAGVGQMPAPIMNFPGLNRNQAGGWIPPDTNGDVGPSYYLQAVNVAFGIYDKATGQQLVAMTFDQLFDGTGTPCDNQNRGDIIGLYDPLADRWLLTDFSLPSTGPVYQCIAISQTGDPIAGGWYFYALVVDDDGSPWHDYPKFGVWPDAYYMSANMFDPWSGAWVWALDRAAMLNGLPMNWVRFETGLYYASLLPSNLRGALPPAGSPNYFASIDTPNTLHLWEFHVDWANPGNSTFTGPTDITVADFQMMPWTSIPQADTSQLLDSLGDRLMFALQYRNLGDHEALWVNHTVLSGGVAGVRWYEVRDPGGTPFIYQQGTYQPDGLYRWMGSVAADQDGNLAVGYSVSSADMHPAIRYAGRLNGETLNTLPQGETSLIEGTGSQTSSNRWGDYSMMTVDPVDDCTFWYTQEYYETNGGTWQTRIGSFKFPSCGQPKGWVAGLVYDAISLAPLPDAPVVAQGGGTTFTIQTDANGEYLMILPGGTYTLTAGPLLPGYPEPTVITGVVVSAGLTMTVDIPLEPKPDLVEGEATVDDSVAGGNGNGYPEPGESGLLLWNTITNDGPVAATDVGAYLTALTPGVTVPVADTTYPDIAPGATVTNNTPFLFSIAPTLPCGTRLDFRELLVTAQGNYTVAFSLNAGVPLPRAALFADNMESGPGNWTTGGANNFWAITTEQAHSPTHAWSDSPYSQYQNNTNAWLRAPTFDFTGYAYPALSFWHRYSTEEGYDYGYLEYSLDGGATWTILDQYDGSQMTWVQESFDTPFFDGQTGATFRFRLTSDGGVTADGWYLDDVELTYQPFQCVYLPPAMPVPVAPADGTVTTDHDVTFTWEPGQGGGGVQGYNLELDGAVYTTTETALPLTLDAGTHTWRVRAWNAGGSSDYTAPWTVTVVDPPATPTLVAPPDGTLTATHEITLTWEAGTGGSPADGYNLELDGAVYTTTETAWTATLASGLHTWRVRAFNLAGYSDYSAAWTVEVLDLPGIPILLAPPDGTITGTQEITFTWQAGTGGAPDGYNLELDGAVYTTTGTALPLTLDAGAHLWRVRAFNRAGYSNYSNTWSVTVVYRVYLPLIVRGQ